MGLQLCHAHSGGNALRAVLEAGRLAGVLAGRPPGPVAARHPRHGPGSHGPPLAVHSAPAGAALLLQRRGRGVPAQTAAPGTHCGEPTAAGGWLLISIEVAMFLRFKSGVSDRL